MPSKTEKQARLMRAVAHGWKKPGGGGPSVAVAKEFVAADKKKKPKKFAEGGWSKTTSSEPDFSYLKQPSLPEEPAKEESFKEAFARNRKEGAKTFEWKGKKFTTELAKPKPKMENIVVEAPRKVKEERRVRVTTPPAKTVASTSEPVRTRAPYAPGTMQRSGIQASEFAWKKGGTVRGVGCAKKGHGKGRMR